MSKVRVEIVEASPGNFRWQVRGADGKVVPVTVGRIMGLGTAAKHRVARKAANEALAQMARSETKSNGRVSRNLAIGH